MHTSKQNQNMLRKREKFAFKPYDNNKQLAILTFQLATMSLHYSSLTFTVSCLQ